jgi:hypothetical protein
LRLATTDISNEWANFFIAVCLKITFCRKIQNRPGLS